MTTLSAIGIGATNITTLGSIGTGTWNATAIGLGYGGTGANLTGTFSNGGILYSSASALAIFAGTATADKLLFSGANTTPTWSTTTWPTTTVINDLIFCTTTANAIGRLPKANTGLLGTGGTGIASWLVSGDLTVARGGTARTSFTVPYAVVAGNIGSIAALGSSLQVLTSAGAGAYPAFANPTQAIAVNQSTGTVTMAAGNRYTINDGASLVTLTLPTSAAIGDTYIIMGQATGAWLVAQNANQTIYGAISSNHSSTGVLGSVSSGNQYNTVTIICVVANTTFVALAPIGSALTYT